MHGQCVLTHVVGGTYCRVLVLTDSVGSEAEERVRVMTVGSTLVPWFIRKEHLEAVFSRYHVPIICNTYEQDQADGDGKNTIFTSSKPLVQYLQMGSKFGRHCRDFPSLSKRQVITDDWQTFHINDPANPFYWGFALLYQVQMNPIEHLG